jgi:hypothetical protein
MHHVGEELLINKSLSLAKRSPTSHIQKVSPRQHDRYSFPLHMLQLMKRCACQEGSRTTSSKEKQPEKVFAVLLFFDKEIGQRDDRKQCPNSCEVSNVTRTFACSVPQVP